MDKHILFNNSRVNICLERLAYELLENHNDFSETVLIGLQPRGKFLSQNIVNVLKNKYSLKVFSYPLFNGKINFLWFFSLHPMTTCNFIFS